MGGVLAIRGFGEAPAARGAIERMAGCRRSRGPVSHWRSDDVMLAVQSRAGDASLGHSEWGTVAFHGYLANRRSLSDEVSRNRPPLKSDGEVAARLFEEFGPTAISRLEGEYALVALEQASRTLYCARSPLGTRPLFGEARGGRIVIASEIRQVLAGSCSSRQLDDEAMVAFLVGGGVEGGRSLFRGVTQFRAGSLSAIPPDSSGLSERTVPFWAAPSLRSSREAGAPADLAAELRWLLLDSVRGALPERPFGVWLSSGLDSSTVWACALSALKEDSRSMTDATAFSLVYPGLSCDESQGIRGILEYTEGVGKQLPASAARLTDYLDGLVKDLDSPPHPTIYSYSLKLPWLRRSSVECVLEGHGGDHLLAGSNGFVSELLLSGDYGGWLASLLSIAGGQSSGMAMRVALGGLRAKLRAIGWGAPNDRRMRRSPRRPTSDPSWLADKWREVAIEARAAAAGQEPSGAQSTPSNRRWAPLSLLGAASGVLHRSEQLAASAGVESRFPLLGERLVSTVLSLPERALLADGKRKGLLRRAMEPLLPERTLYRTPKVLFSPLVQRDFAAFPAGVFSGTAGWHLVRRGFVSADGLDRLIARAYTPTGIREKLQALSIWCSEVFVRYYFS